MNRKSILLFAITAPFIIFFIMNTLFEKSEITDNQTDKVLLGDDRLISEYSSLIDGKKIGIITNQTGVNSDGTHIIKLLYDYKQTSLTSIFAPEHGLDGTSTAGEYVQSYTHPEYKLPVYSLYGATRKPSNDMLKNIDTLIFDIQDIGIRSYTYISTLNYAMIAAKENNKKIIILDRPNPLGGIIVEGYVSEDPYLSFVGVDNLPVSHGMTIGELAKFFNRKIGADISIVPMKNYKRTMTYKDTGLNWIPTSPNIPTINSAFNYSATGIGEGLGTIKQGNYFNWAGGTAINSESFAKKLNSAKLPGVSFKASTTDSGGGADIIIEDYSKYNPARTGIYVLTYARDLAGINILKSTSAPTMFQKIHGTDKIGQYLEQGKSAEEIIELYTPRLEQFKKEREQYLIYE